MKKTVIIIGAGPAGLTSGLLLSEKGHEVLIYEADDKYVGGLSRTVVHNGFRIDIGGHRFFSKDQEVNVFWHKILKNDFLRRKRLSRILYKALFLEYPLRFKELFIKLGLKENTHLFLSYCKSKLFPPPDQKSFQDWIIAHFGEELFITFFKSYTEKVWGMSCRDISSDWAQQRINNLSLKKLLLRLLFDKREVKSLIEEFDYPRLGPGMMWEKVQEEILQNKGQVFFQKKITGIIQHPLTKKWAVQCSSEQSIWADEIISSMPLAELIKALGDRVDKNAQIAAEKLKHRSFLTVAVMFKGKNAFLDNWIYIQDTRVKVARIQNFANWSPEMVPSPEHVCYGLEYFCQENDEFWSMSDESLFKFALRELSALGLEYSELELDYLVIRSNHAYPVYDLNYADHVKKIKQALAPLTHIHPIGRSGLHRYNNQDHSMKTAMLTALNILKGEKTLDPWKVNQDAEYIEVMEA